MFALLHFFPKLRQWSTAVGVFIMAFALGLSSLARNTTHLILAQGIGYAIGAGFAYAPTIVFMDEWFVQKKGLAFGIMWVRLQICFFTVVKLSITIR
jgi:hypothetical protein